MKENFERTELGNRIITLLESSKYFHENSQIITPVDLALLLLDLRKLWQRFDIYLEAADFLQVVFECLLLLDERIEAGVAEEITRK